MAEVLGYTSVLFMLTIYHDHQRAGEMLGTLGQCLLPGTEDWPGHTQLRILDCTEGTENERVPEVSHALRRLDGCSVAIRRWTHRVGLPEALNSAVQHAMELDFEYVSWIHPDMDFTADPLWFQRCAQWLRDHKICGKASPREFRTLEEAEKRRVANNYAGPVHGNACPWVMRVEDCKALWEAAGYLLDPEYFLMHFEDWDLINRLQTELGKSADILPWAQVVHEGMGTRSHHDYGESLRQNKAYYEKKWGIKGFHL